MTVLVMGVSGCGKTTVGAMLARELGWDFIDADDWHPEANRAKMKAGVPLQDSDRMPWLDSLAELIRTHERDGKSLVLACSALKRSYRQRLGFVEAAATADGAGPALVERRLVFLRVDPPLSASRVSSRPGHFMNPSLVASQFAALEEPIGPATLRVESSGELKSLLSEIKAWLLAKA